MEKFQERTLGDGRQNGCFFVGAVKRGNIPS